MIEYDKYNFGELRDNAKLAFSPMIGALDIQYSHYTPYLWTFCVDNSLQVAYGRTWDDLRRFFNTLSNQLHLWAKVDFQYNYFPESDEDRQKNKELSTQNPKVQGHFLKVIVPDLSEFFTFSKHEIDYLPLPFFAKSPSEILLATMAYGVQLMSYKEYYETELDEDMRNEGIYIPAIEKNTQSARCKLLDDEKDYSENRVLFMAKQMSYEVDTNYGGHVSDLVLTKTAAITRRIGQNQRRKANKCKCNIQAQTMKMNPLCSERGKNEILPLLQTAFFGGVAFYEYGVINKIFENVKNADLTSAYIAAMMLHKFPVGAFRSLDETDIREVCEDWHVLFSPKYKRRAMLITIEVEGLELKPGGFPFLPANGRHRYRDYSGDKKHIRDEIEREELICSTRVKSTPHLCTTLTDIDFTLLCENYTFESIEIQNILYAPYGWLPDYISEIIVQLYSDKSAFKKIIKELKKAGEVSNQLQYAYDLKKSEPARLYGIFCQSPTVRRYIYNPESRAPLVINEAYIADSQKYRPVLYQWGVWTTARVRAEIAALRNEMQNAPAERQIKVISGDTDCINYAGDATDIIARYNEHVKSRIAARAKTLGVEDTALQDLGTMDIASYKYFKTTGLKQYCYIRESDKGEVFGYKVGGMSPECKYFDKVCNTNMQRMELFSVGLVIERKYKPRRYMVAYDEEIQESWKDRDGNSCDALVKSYRREEYERFVIHKIMSADKLANAPTPRARKFSKDEVSRLAGKIAPTTIDYAELFAKIQRKGG